jgi:hypothetical protein
MEKTAESIKKSLALPFTLFQFLATPLWILKARAEIASRLRTEKRVQPKDGAVNGLELRICAHAN